MYFEEKFPDQEQVHVPLPLDLIFCICFVFFTGVIHFSLDSVVRIVALMETYHSTGLKKMVKGLELGTNRAKKK